MAKGSDLANIKMAVKEINVTEVNEEIKDLTECCVCLNRFTDPRSLPCLHTFCLKCLETTGSTNSNRPGGQMPCPVCRKEFTIPVEGFTGIQKNFFMERLMKVSTVLSPISSEGNLCDACKEEGDLEASAVPTAETYCTECHQKLCHECTKHHRKYNVTKGHRVIAIGTEVSPEELQQAFVESNCDKHKVEHLEIYCSDCREVMCPLCYIESHQSHSWSDVKQALEEFRKEIDNNICKSSAFLSDFLERKEMLETRKSDLLREIGDMEQDILREGENMKIRVDKDLRLLLEELNDFKEKMMKEIAIEGEDVDRHLTIVESYERYSSEIKKRGPANEIFGALMNLNVRVVELKEMHDSLIQRQIPFVSLSFIKTELEKLLKIKSTYNILGEIEDNDHRKEKGGEDKTSRTDNPKKSDTLTKQVDGPKEEELDKERTCNEQLESKLIDEAGKTMFELKQTIDELHLELDEKVAELKSIKEELRLCKERGNTETNQAQLLEKKLEDEISRSKKNAEEIEKLDEELSRSKKEMEEKLFRRDEKEREWLERERQITERLKELEQQRMTEATCLKQEMKSGATDGADCSETRPAEGSIIYKSDPDLIKVIRTTSDNHTYFKGISFLNTGMASIAGMTICNEELFIIDQSLMVEVYDFQTFSFNRTWTLKNQEFVILDYGIGLVSSEKDKCLYVQVLYQRGNVVDGYRFMKRIDQNGRVINQWRFEVNYNSIFSMSVTQESNIIVSICDKNELIAWTPEGKQIRIIKLGLSANVRRPTINLLHAIKLTSGHYMASNSDRLHRVCIVDVAGNILKSFGEEKGSGQGQLNGPVHLAVDGEGSILVLDQQNRRVLLLNSDLEFKREILSKKHFIIQSPRNIHLDEKTGRLFVVDGVRRILVFNIK